MKQIWTGIQLAFTAVGGFLGWFLGGLDGFLYPVFALIHVLPRIAVHYSEGGMMIIEKKLPFGYRFLKTNEG